MQSYQYFLWDDYTDEHEVSKEEFVAAERKAGFFNTMGQPDEPATGSFGTTSFHHLSGTQRAVVVVMCACGRPLHYTNPASERTVRNMVRRLGTHTTVSVEGYGSYRVPRHFIALHGINAAMLPHIAATYGFERVRDA